MEVEDDLLELVELGQLLWPKLDYLASSGGDTRRTGSAASEADLRAGMASSQDSIEKRSLYDSNEFFALLSARNVEV